MSTAADVEPWITRGGSMKPTVGESATATHATTYSDSEASSSPRRPYTSLKGPSRSCITPKAIVYKEMVASTISVDV